MNSDTPGLALPPHVTIATVAAIDGQLKELSLGGREVVIDASHVERADAAGLQLMVVLAREARVRQGGVTFLVSEAFRRSADILGLSAELVMKEAS